MPKAVYRSGCHDKHNRPRCDSNLGPLTPQSDALTTSPLRPGTYNFVAYIFYSTVAHAAGHRKHYVSSLSVRACVHCTVSAGGFILAPACRRDFSSLPIHHHDASPSLTQSPSLWRLYIETFRRLLIKDICLSIVGSVLPSVL